MDTFTCHANYPYKKMIHTTIKLITNPNSFKIFKTSLNLLHFLV